LVIGGGITGLSAAWRAQTLSKTTEITVLEKGHRFGGKILTEHRDGFVLEAGADGFLARKPAGIDLCYELGIKDLLREQVPRQSRSFVMRGHKLHPLPEGFSGLVPTNLQALIETPLLSEAGKRRALEESAIPARRDEQDESVSQFMTRRFGKEVFDALIEPLLAGIHAGDASCISMKAAFPHLRDLERRQASPIHGSPFVTFTGGMEALVQTLSRSLIERGVRVMMGTEASSIKRRGDAWRVELSRIDSIDADAVIVTASSARAAGLLDGVDKELGDTLAEIPCSSTAVIHLGFRQDDVGHELDGYGYLIPRIEGSDLLACTWSSSKWEGRAPSGMILLRLYAGRYGGSDILRKGDQDLTALAVAELRDTMGITALPIFSRVFRWPDAMPQYTLGHPVRMRKIEKRRTTLGSIFLAGASYEGVGIPDCIESGFRAAREAMEYFQK
jgi:oxygen-dependent protoporphyrinogen oxidase